MKKCLVIFVSLLCLCACDNNFDGENVSQSTSDIPSFTSSLHSGMTNLPEYMYPVNYSSLSELAQSIQKENESELYSVFYEDPDDKKTEKFRGFVTKLQEESIPVPCLNGKIIDFRGKEGFPNISLFASESYDLPWICYFPSVPTGENFYIKVTFIPDEIISDKGDTLTASELIKKISPDSPNLNNIGDYYDNIYEKKLTLEERDVTALVMTHKTDQRNATMFVYSNMLVEVRGDPEAWSDEWFSTLSFASLEG